MKVIIVGGVAGGATAAARLRRLDENAEIILMERGDYVAYANCGLPYYIGGEITQKSALTLQTPESLRLRMNLDVRTRHEVIRLFPGDKEVEVRDLNAGLVYRESYDKLILSPGAEAVRPAFPGADDPRVFTLRIIPDTYRIHDYIREAKPRKALLVGAGYIGLEMAENLQKAGLTVIVAEMSDHAIGPLDSEMAADVHHYLKSQGVELLLQNGVQAIQPTPEKLHVQLVEGELDVDMVVLSIGVRPESGLAQEAGLRLGSRGAILVDEYMRSSDPDIYAVGDAVEVRQVVNGQPAYIALAGPANKQGRVAADHIARGTQPGKAHAYVGSQGTAIIKLFDMTIGSSGLNETALKDSGLDYDKVYLNPNSHANYYPGATPISMKVLFEKPSGRILGAQLLGFDGVDKRLDVFAVAIRQGMTGEDLAQLELAYAPPYSSAKDPVNMAGFIIQNILEGESRQFHWHDVATLQAEKRVILDVSSPMEYAGGHIDGAINIPVDELRDRLAELDKTKPVYLYCMSGVRSYLASRILAAHGFDASTLSGGFRLYMSAALGISANIPCPACHKP